MHLGSKSPGQKDHGQERKARLINGGGRPARGQAKAGKAKHKEAEKAAKDGSMENGVEEEQAKADRGVGCQKINATHLRTQGGRVADDN